MKNILSIFLSLVFFSSISFAQEKASIQQDSQAYIDSTNKQILKELVIIRGLQLEVKKDRLKELHYMEQHENELEKIPKNEYGAMLQVEKNTRRHWNSDGFNLFGIFTFLFSLVSALFSCFNYKEQKNTEEHTSKAPINVQLWKLKDMSRHFYRNLACTCALIFKYRAEGDETTRKHYPSESNLGKLQTLPDDVVLPIDVNETKDPQKNPYNYMHEFKLLLRNYNKEVEVASKHLSRKNISEASLKQDFNNLLFKPLYLTERAFQYEKSLIIQKKAKVFGSQLLARLLKKTKLGDTKECEIFFAKRTVITILTEHFKKLEDPRNFRVLFYEDCAKNYLDIILKSKVDTLKTYIEGKTCDEVGSVDRSIEGLINYGKREKCDISEIDKKTTIEEVIKELNTTDKNYTHFFYGETTGENNKVYPGILSIRNKTEFMAFCKGVGYNMGRTECSKLFDYIVPYLNYLRREKWETATLIKRVLAIDAAIETSRIGMVNYD